MAYVNLEFSPLGEKGQERLKGLLSIKECVYNNTSVIEGADRITDNVKTYDLGNVGLTLNYVVRDDEDALAILVDGVLVGDNGGIKGVIKNLDLEECIVEDEK